MLEILTSAGFDSHCVLRGIGDRMKKGLFPLGQGKLKLSYTFPKGLQRGLPVEIPDVPVEIQDACLVKLEFLIKTFLV